MPAPAWAEVDPAVLKAEADRVAVVAKASSVAVAVFAANGQGGGSGVVISSDGYALSNFHVTREAGDAMKCGMADGKLYDAVIVGLDPTGDVALIKLLGRDDFPHAELADSDKVRVGDWCFAIGNPFLLATDFHPTVSYGVVSGVHRYQYPAGTLLEYADCLQADAAINPGNSGGPLFDADGRLIGINGRGSFEKRGRVNVGVGYAISINQIKNFLGHLKSGRIVDHATLGARLSPDENRHVVVDDILEESDAARRGLQYGDEVVRFAGRPIGTVNAFKNALGIFPKGWRVELTYRRKGETIQTVVRLRGVHREAELAQLLAKPTKPMPGDKPKSKPKPKHTPEQPGDDPEHESNPLDMLLKKPMPAIVKQHFEARAGYVNYYFNRLNQDRVWKGFTARGDFSPLAGVWKLSGEVAAGGEAELEISGERSQLTLPGGEVQADLAGNLATLFDPPGSGGLLVTLGMWRRMLVLGPAKFGQVHYLGTEPLPGRQGLFDVLVAAHRDIECRFLFDPADGQLALVEMFPDDDADPCELYFFDYHEVEGRLLPGRMEVRNGDHVYHDFKFGKFELRPAGEK